MVKPPGASIESNRTDTKCGSSQNSDSDLYSSSEETRLLPKRKEVESPEAKEKYPKSIFFIVGNEFCERFSFYGLRAVLTIYLSQRLYYSENTSTIIFHLFAMISYFTPLFGAIMADSWLGKFRTIFYISILYALGCVMLSVGAFPNDLSIMKLISLVGLFVIALGTGGIKPCVSAFGGDQFKEGQEVQLQKFFGIFYFAINSGSVISTFLTPILREDVHCFGENTCYPVAFGVPAVLMVAALILFVCGKPLYVRRPPEGNIIVRVTKCICHAIGKKYTSNEKKKSHWLDYAEDKFDKNLIRDIKILFHVLILYIPLPIFWALFDQQASRWTLQATRLDGEVGNYHIKADQMQVINPLLILTFIPLFDWAIYPLLAKFKLLTKPLQRITTGGILAAISFVVAGLIELHLETSYPVMPKIGQSELIIMNNSPCSISINDTNVDTMDAFTRTTVRDLTLGELSYWKFAPENCKLSKSSLIYTLNSTDEIETMMITLIDGKVTVEKTNDTKTKSKDGEPQIRVFYNVDRQYGNVSFAFKGNKKDFIIDGGPEPYGITKYSKFVPGRYNLYLSYNNTHYDEANPVGDFSFKSGGISIVTIYNKSAEVERKSKKFDMVKGNYLSIFFQIPQYFIITAGEIMFSITGLEFSYSQSPTSMKSVVQAAWLLTVAFGNLIVLIIAKLKLFDKQSHELFLFATLMAIDMIVFAILAYFYKYVTIKTPSAEAAATEAADAKSEKVPVGTLSVGSSNEAYVEEETDFNKT